jgi:winged helix DNA-binding protein
MSQMLGSQYSPMSRSRSMWTVARPAGDAAFADQTVVKATLMRITLHAVHAEDYPAFHNAMLPSLRAARLSDRRFIDTGLSVAEADALIPELLEFAARPRTGARLRSCCGRGWVTASRGCGGRCGRSRRCCTSRAAGRGRSVPGRRSSRLEPSWVRRLRTSPCSGWCCGICRRSALPRCRTSRSSPCSGGRWCCSAAGPGRQG